MFATLSLAAAMLAAQAAPTQEPSHEELEAAATRAPVIATTPAPSPRYERAPPATVIREDDDSWASGARFFGGLRTSVAIPPGGKGVAPLLGFELGVSARRGIGFGLHLISVANPPGIPSLKIPEAEFAIGAAADIRYYIQTVEPLSLYPTLSVGFLAGPAADGGENAVLPLLNPGFGARVRLDPIYIAFEFGLAGFYIPFVAISFGWEPKRPAHKPAVAG